MLRSPSREEPPPLGDSPPPSPGWISLPRLRSIDGDTGEHAPEHFPCRWGVRPSDREAWVKPPQYVAPTESLLRKRLFNNAAWNLLERNSWTIKDPFQRTLMPPLSNKRRTVKVDSSHTWARRVRLQLALQTEAKLEAWLESIGQGKEVRRVPSHAHLNYLSWQARGDSEWDEGLGWTTPTEHDIPSELGSEYDEFTSGLSCCG